MRGTASSVDVRADAPSAPGRRNSHPNLAAFGAMQPPGPGIGNAQLVGVAAVRVRAWLFEGQHDRPLKQRSPAASTPAGSTLWKNTAFGSSTPAASPEAFLLRTPAGAYGGALRRLDSRRRGCRTPCSQAITGTPRPGSAHRMPSGGLTGYPQSAALQQVGGLELVVEGARVSSSARRQREGAGAAVRSDASCDLQNCQANRATGCTWKATRALAPTRTSSRSVRAQLPRASKAKRWYHHVRRPPLALAVLSTDDA